MGNTCCTSRDSEEPTGIANPLTPGGPHLKEKDGTGQPPIGPRVRDKKYIFEITFSKFPLGVIFTSSIYGTSTYVTGTDGKNDEVTDKNLPKESKLLKINDVDVEWQTMDKTTELLNKLMNDLPISMTFCHPDGLGEDEYQDPDPKDDYTKVATLQRRGVFPGKSLLRSVKVNKQGSSFLMPIQNVYNVPGKGATVKGTIERGVVKVGDKVEVVGIKDTSSTTVKEVSVYRHVVDEGRQGEEVEVLVFGKHQEFAKGQVLCTPGSITAYKNFDAEVSVERDITSGDTRQFYFRTLDINGTIDLPNVETLLAGENGTISVTLESYVAIEEGTSFEIRDDGITIGSGSVSPL